MATYGGGINFINVQSYIDIVVSNTSVVYTVPAGAYADFKLLSVKVITGTGTNNTSDTVVTVENDDATGTWLGMAQSTYVTTWNSPGTPTSTPINLEYNLFKGQRIKISNTQTGGAGSQTVRLSYSYNEYTPST